MKKAIFFMLICWGLSYADGESKGVNSNEGGSGHFLNVFTDEGTIENAALQAGDAAITTREAVKNAPTTFKKFGKSGAVSAAKAAAISYTNSKVSATMAINNALKKANKAVEKAAKRVDMWMNTKPQLDAYKLALEQLANDTKELYNDFTWEKFFDPKRKWDKRREALFDADIDGSHWRGAWVDQYKGFESFWVSRYKEFESDAWADKRKRDAEKKRKMLKKIVVPSVDETKLKNIVTRATAKDSSGVVLEGSDGLSWAIDESKIPNFKKWRVPFATLNYCAEAMGKLAELEMSFMSDTVFKSRDGKEDTMSIQGARMSYIAEKMENTRQTLYDTEYLSFVIAQERTRVQADILQAQQTQALLQTYWANLNVRTEDAVTEQFADTEASFMLMSGGIDAYKYFFAYVTTERAWRAEQALKEAENEN